MAQQVRRMAWKDPRVRRAFMDDLAYTRGIQEGAESWSTVTSTMLVRAGGAGLLKRYRGSMVALLQDVYPERSGEEHAAKRKRPQGYWRDAANRRLFMDGVRERLGVQQAEDWRQLSVQKLRQMGGASLLWHYNGSVAALLRDVYPEEAGEERCVRRWVSRSHWACEERQMAFLEQVAEEFGVECAEDWRRVTRKAVVTMGGAGLISRHASIAAALHTLGQRARESGRGGPLGMCGTNEATIARWRPTVPPDHWKCADNVREFLEEAASRLGLTTWEDWGRVSSDQLKAIPGGAGLLRFYSLSGALAVAYPGREVKRPHSVRAAQRHLCLRLADLFVCKERQSAAQLAN